MSGPHPAGTASKVAAVVVPLSLLAGGFGLLARPSATERSPRAQELEQGLAQASPEVVLVGNSMVGKAVDDQALASALQLPVAQVRENGTSAATWYALVKNRVLNAGHRPRLVIVAGGVRQMLQTGTPSSFDQDALLLHLDHHEPVVWRKTFGKDSPSAWLGTAQRRRNALREGLLDGIRDAGIWVAGATDADGALSRLFETEGAVDMDLRRRVLPVVEVARGAGVGSASRTADAAESYIADLVELSREHDFALVLVRLPLRPGNAEDALPAHQVQELVAWLNQQGVGWLDMSSLALSGEDFTDKNHLAISGRRRLTAALSQELQAIGALDEEGPRPAFLMRSSPPQRVGSPPALSALELSRPADCQVVLKATLADQRWLPAMRDLAQAGLGRALPIQVLEGERVLNSGRGAAQGDCGGSVLPWARSLQAKPFSRGAEQFSWRWHPDSSIVEPNGQAWTWLLPQTGLRVDVQEAPSGPMRLNAWLWALEDGSPAPTLQADGLALPAPAEADGRWFYSAELPRAPGTVLVQAVDGMGPVLVEGLTLSAEGREGWLLGNASLSRAGSSVIVGRRQKDDVARYASEPPPVEVGDRRLENGILRIDVPGLASVDAEACRQATGIIGCTPLQLLHKGEPVAEKPSHWGIVRKGTVGTWSHRGTLVERALLEGEAPEDFSLRLDPERREGVYRWLYPGDALRPTAPTSERMQLRAGANRLALSALTLRQPDVEPAGSLRLRIADDDRVYLDQEIPLASLDGAVLSLAFQHRTPRLMTPPLELLLPLDAPFVLIKELQFLEAD